eukprot:tig00020563_g11291.t1
MSAPRQSATGCVLATPRASARPSAKLKPPRAVTCHAKFLLPISHCRADGGADAALTPFLRTVEQCGPAGVRSISVVMPDARTVLNAGDTLKIRWVARNVQILSLVQVSLLKNVPGFPVESVLVRAYDNRGFFNWGIPEGTPSGLYVVEVAEIVNAVLSETIRGRSAPFTVVGEPCTPLFCALSYYLYLLPGAIGPAADSTWGSAELYSEACGAFSAPAGPDGSCDLVEQDCSRLRCEKRPGAPSLFNVTNGGFVQSFDASFVNCDSGPGIKVNEMVYMGRDGILRRFASPTFVAPNGTAQVPVNADWFFQMRNVLPRISKQLDAAEWTGDLFLVVSRPGSEVKYETVFMPGLVIPVPAEAKECPGAIPPPTPTPTPSPTPTEKSEGNITLQAGSLAGGAVSAASSPAGAIAGGVLGAAAAVAAAVGGVLFVRRRNAQAAARAAAAAAKAEADGEAPAAAGVGALSPPQPRDFDVYPEPEEERGSLARRLWRWAAARRRGGGDVYPDELGYPAEAGRGALSEEEVGRARSRVAQADERPPLDNL